MSSRKRTEFTLKKKKETIDAAKNEPNQCKLAVARAMSEKWEIDVKRTTVKGILSKTRGMKSRKNIYSAYNFFIAFIYSVVA